MSAGLFHLKIGLIRSAFSCFLVSALVFASAAVMHGAISVGPTGLAAITFDTLPPSTSWSFLSVGAVGDVATVPGLDALVQTNAPDMIAAQLEANNGNPPGNSPNARWSSTGFYLQTRPTGNAATLLMATLRNDSGQTITSLRIEYDYVQRYGAAIIEMIPGHRLYYNLSGTAGTWVALGNFGARDPLNTPQPQSILIDLATTPWVSGTTLHLLFADHNASGPDFAGGIDNFAIPMGDMFPVILEQPTEQTVIAGGTATFRVTAAGALPLTYQWRFEEVAIADATNRILTLATVQSSHAGRYSVVVSNGSGSVTSTPALLTVLVPPSIATQPVSQSAEVGSSVTLAVTASGTEPFTYQWRFNGGELSGATNQALTIANAQFTNAGNYSVVVNNSAGTVTSGNAVLWFLGGIDLYPGLLIYGPPGAIIRVEYTTGFAADANATWTVLTNFSLPSNPYLFVDPTPARQEKRFYRAMLVP